MKEPDKQQLLTNIEKKLNLLLTSVRAQLDTSKYIKSPNGLFLNAKAWDNISDARNIYLETITKEIDNLLMESKK